MARARRGLTRRRLIGVGAVFAASLTTRIARAIGDVDLRRAEQEQATRSSSLCSADNAAGKGLRGEYFAGAAWLGETLLVRDDANVDFAPSLDWPARLRARAPRSARWRGWLKAPVTGAYAFHVVGAEATVIVARKDVSASKPDAPATIDLVAGRYYPIELAIERLRAPRDNGRVRLEWTLPYGARYVVPAALLRLPTDTVRPG